MVERCHQCIRRFALDGFTEAGADAAPLVGLGRAGVNGEETGVYYHVDKAADWPLQFAIRLGDAALQFVLGSPLAAEVASQGLARLETRDSNRQSEGAAVSSLAFIYNDHLVPGLTAERKGAPESALSQGVRR